MFFIISKLLGFLLSPFIWVFLLLIGALVMVKRRKPLIKINLLVIFIFGNGFLFDEISRLWEFEFQPLSPNEKYDVAIVLGGFSSYDPKVDLIEFHEASDRFIHGLHLYETKKVNRLLLSGGSGSLLGLDQEGVYMFPFTQEFGVRNKDLWVDSLSKNTYENAVNCKKILESHNFEGSIVLVTSAMHMNRALGCFKNVGLTPTPYPVDRFAGPRKYHFDHLFIPNLHTMFKWKALFHEVLGYMVYSIKGYL